MPDQNHEKQKHANNVVQFHLRKMKYQVEHPIRSKIKPLVKYAFFFIMALILYNLLFQQKPLQAVPLSKHEYIIGDNNTIEIQISPNENGLYVIPATINKEKIHLIVDSGANGVSIPESVAERANLKKGQLLTATTAAGPTIVYKTQVSALEIQRIRFVNIEAHISPAMNLDGVLLGTNVLQKFEIIIKNKIMTLRCQQYVSC